MLAALKISEVHKAMVIKKFDKYIVSYVAAGSLFRGEKSHDIDVYVVVDDTDVKKMSRFELRDKLRSIIINMGFQAADITGVKKLFHIQVYILTDFWESVKDASPVIFTFLRDGVPLGSFGNFLEVFSRDPLWWQCSTSCAFEFLGQLEQALSCDLWIAGSSKQKGHFLQDVWVLEQIGRNASGARVS